MRTMRTIGATRAIWIACALAACKRPNGVLLDIPAPHAELFIANGTACSDTPPCAFTPPDTNSPASPGATITGQGWVIDSALTEVTVPNGHSEFELEAQAPQGGSPQVPALLVVAYDSNATDAPPTGFAMLTSVDVPASAEVKISVDLTPYQPITAQASGDSLELWRKLSDTARVHSQCALVRHHDGTYDFFSPEDDMDCDDTEPLDCNKLGFHTTAQPSTSELACALGTTGAACRFGGFPCVDGQGPTTTCALPTGEAYCTVPEACGSDGCSGSFDLACSGQLRNATRTLHCQVGLIDTLVANQSCALEPQQTTTVNLSTFAPVCQSIRISALNTPLAFGSSAMVGQSKVSVTLQAPCTAAFTFKDAATDTSGTFDNAVLLLDLQTPSPNPVHLVIPMTLAPTQLECAMSCTTPSAGTLQCP